MSRTTYHGRAAMAIIAWSMMVWSTAFVHATERSASEQGEASATDTGGHAVPGAAADGAGVTDSPDVRAAGASHAAKSLDTVVVEGAMPGPGMWQVKKGEHTLWLLGRIAPLPKKMDWRADEVQRVLDGAAVVIAAPSVTVAANVGFWGALRMAPKAMGARKDPEKEPLSEQVPPEVYARWKAMKAKYLGDKRSVEKYRPIFAAERLVKSAIRRSRLTEDRWVDEQVEKWAKKRKVEVVRPAAKVTIEDPKQMLGEFTETRLDDLACFESTLDWLERDLDLMRQRANAWAIGDIEMLRELAGENPRIACIDTLLRSDMFRKRGFEDLPQRQQDAWLEAVDAALAEHAISLGILPLDAMLGEGEYLTALRERGYEVIAPE